MSHLLSSYSSAVRIKPLGKQLVALTGGIGSGKSFILRCFNVLGFHTIDTDSMIRQLLAPGGGAEEEVMQYFPQAIIDKHIDRTLLGDIVFSDTTRLTILESILHPKVSKMRWEKINWLHQRSRRSIIVEVPLFFERTSLEERHKYNLVAAAVCATEIQKSRAMSRKGMTITKFNAIMAQQEEERRRYADLVIETDSSKQHVFKQIRKVVNNGIKRNCIRYGNHRPFYTARS